MMTNKLGHTDLVFLFLIIVYLQDYKPLHLAVVICATLVNTHTHTDCILTCYTISSGLL